MKPSLGAIPEMLYCNRASGGPPDAPFEADAGMKWFRSNIRLGSRFALFALAIQFLLSFGHFHGGAQTASASLAQLPGIHAGIVVAAVHRGGSDQASRANTPRVVGLKTSTDHLPAGQPCDDCAICTVMALVNVMVVAAPPDLPAPHATAFSYSSTDAGFTDLNSARVAFQPRAPPIA
jgi:hypothetical protein